MTVEAGAPAPRFTLDGDTGPIDLAAPGRATVLYFYPKDDTSGCTSEAKAFTELYEEFLNAAAEVVGVSRDDTKSHAKFRAKYGLTHPLGADADGAVTEAYGVWVKKSMYGREYMGDRAGDLPHRQGRQGCAGVAQGEGARARGGGAGGGQGLVMADFFDILSGEHTDFIRRQPVFFVATAAQGGRVNVSPKGMDAFRVLAPDKVGYLDVGGSGNETQAHLAADGRGDGDVLRFRPARPDPAPVWPGSSGAASRRGVAGAGGEVQGARRARGRSS